MLQLTGGFSLISGNAYGRVIGMFGAGLGAIGALLSIGGANPWWSLAIFALCIYIIHGLVELGEDEERLPEIDGLGVFARAVPQHDGPRFPRLEPPRRVIGSASCGR